MRIMDMPETIESADLTLEKLWPDHIEHMVKWHNDPKVQKFTNTKGKETHDGMLDWFFSEYNRSQKDIIYVVHVDSFPCGYLTFKCENSDIAEIGIVINEDNRKHGVAFKSLGLLCRTAFDKGIRKIKARILVDNYDALKLAYRLGFEKEGFLRREVYHQGEQKNSYLFSLFEEELKYENLVSSEL